MPENNNKPNKLEILMILILKSYCECCILVNKLKESLKKNCLEENLSIKKSKGKHFREVVKPFMTNKVKSGHLNVILFDDDNLINKPINNFTELW